MAVFPDATPEPDAVEAALSEALSAQGLRLRGYWLPDARDTLPQLPDGSAPGVVWMVGAVGSAFWPHFKQSAPFLDGQPDPLDRWSRALGDALAQRWGGLALYPFDGPPYHPFQRWADRAEPTQPSALMLRIHPQYGLWHAYRFALALPAAAAQTAAPPQPRPALAAVADPGLCARCSGQPCLSACPVGAYTGQAFLLQACADHVHSPAGQDCLGYGCRARAACPVAPELRYTTEHAAFHMQAFAQRH